MFISSKKLIGVGVETKSAQKLGTLRELELDTETFNIVRLYVRPEGIIKGLVDGDLIISKDSIISIDEERIIVEDLVEEELATEKSANKIAVEGSPMVASSLE